MSAPSTTTDATVAYTCPGCSTVVALPREMLGKTVRCGHCHWSGQAILPVPYWERWKQTWSVQSVLSSLRAIVWMVGVLVLWSFLAGHLVPSQRQTVLDHAMASVDILTSVVCVLGLCTGIDRVLTYLKELLQLDRSVTEKEKH